MKVAYNNLEEFMKWGYIISYLNIKYEDYYVDEDVLVVNREQPFSKVEMIVIDDFCKRRKYGYKLENDTKIIIDFKP